LIYIIIFYSEKNYNITIKKKNGGKEMKLKVGQKAPDFTLPSHLDRDITLSDFRGKYVVMAFYPQAWTPV
jgi:peroxiredoxin Q/BCP